MFDFYECTCRNPIIICDNRGCYCTMCGGFPPITIEPFDSKKEWMKPKIEEVEVSDAQ